MPPEKMSDPQPIVPIEVTVIQGTGDRAPLASGLISTPADQPNIVVNVISPLVAILIRFLNTYLTTLVGLISAGMVTDIIPATDFVALVIACGKLSFAGAGLDALKNLVTIFGKLEGKFPLLTGNV